jgi:hypothetical protein
MDDFQISKRFGEKEQCELVISSELKPVDFQYNQLAISDGHAKGCVEPHIYILYVNGSNS